MNKKYLLIIPIFIFMLFLITGLPDTVKAKITHVETHKGVYLVYTNKGTFKNVDNWLFLKFDSSDFQGKIAGMVEKEVKITKIGWRWSFQSWYENILSIEN